VSLLYTTHRYRRLRDATQLKEDPCDRRTPCRLMQTPHS
jgi:hypothetical protein